MKVSIFFGIQYLGTQPSNNTNVQHLDEKNTFQNTDAHCLSSLGGDNPAASYASDKQARIVPHPRTLRKARENVKQMESLSKGSEIIFQIGLLGGLGQAKDVRMNSCVHKSFGLLSCALISLYI